MVIVTLSLLGLLVGNKAWENMEALTPLLIPKILKILDYSPPLEEPQRRQIEDLGVYHERSIPMYLRHLRDPKNIADTRTILVIIRNMNNRDIVGYNRLFLPHATKGLKDAAVRDSSMLFIMEHGSVVDAKPVAELLFEPKIETGTIRQILKCLEKIGGKDEIPILKQFVTKTFAQNPKIIWAIEVDPCCKIIEDRLKNIAKNQQHKN